MPVYKKITGTGLLAITSASQVWACAYLKLPLFQHGVTREIGQITILLGNEGANLLGNYWCQRVKKLLAPAY